MQTLQNRGVVVMGFTHRQPKAAETTLRQVRSLGFDFRITAPFIDGIEIPAKTPACYSQGILFAGDYNKKIDILNPFLSLIQMKPKKIVFIDDKRKNVDELEALTGQGIEYIGVHYTAISHRPPTYVPELAQIQRKFFLDTLLSNDEAMQLILSSQ